MSTDAVNTGDLNVFVYPRWNTLLGPPGGDPPGSNDTFESAHAIKVIQSASGSRLDFCDIKWGLTEFLINRTQPADFTRMVDVVVPDGIGTRLFRGDYVVEAESVVGGDESLMSQAQLRSYHFGDPVKGMLVYDPIAQADATIPYHISFNPTVDDQVRFNRSQKVPVDSSVDSYWLHPEAGWNKQSQTFHDTSPEPVEWDLWRAVDTMCTLLNADEEFVDNPDNANILANAPKIRDVVLKLGWYLPECLDALLIPNGFNWFVDYGTGNDKPKITLFEIGSGTEKELYYQAPGEELNLNWTNLQQYTINRNIGDSFNQVRVLGGFKQYEVTLPLYPAWPETEDETTPSELNKVSEGGSYSGNETVWRQFIANEDGTLDENTSRLGQNPIIPDLSSVSSPWVPRRRVLEEPLTYMGQQNDEDSRERRPFWLEYSDEMDESNDPVWQPVPDDWSVRLLPDQTGVYFDGDTPPQELFDAGEDLRLRITGTWMVDERIVGEALKEAGAVNGRTFEQVFDMPDKFVFRERLTTTDFESVLNQGTAYNEADERDDSDDLQTYAEALRDQNHHAQVDCEFRLPGLHVEYQIGDIITKINGREVSLDAASAESSTSRFVQVVERRWEFGENGPWTVLVVDRGVNQKRS